MGKKWIGHARLLVEVPSTSIEYCELYKFQKKLDLRGSPGSPSPRSLVPGPWSPGPLFIPTCKSLGWENVVSPSNQVTVIVSTINKHVHISFMVPLLVLQGHVCPPKSQYVQTLCYLCGFCPDCTLI